ncbi:interleukin 12Ba [Latimeria chalumnae]|uniref:interleukin 12Ba n=1 Tax=Latimeria chalumnae TaxID=7897 RepID=UPI00313E9D1C
MDAASTTGKRLKMKVYIVDSEMTPDTPAEPITLHCDAPEDQNPSGIVWKRNFGEGPYKIPEKGNTITINVKDYPDAGNYTCHLASKDEIINYTVIAIHVVNKGKKEENSKKILKKIDGPKQTRFVDCEARSYCGAFNCSWTLDKKTGKENVMFSIKFLEGFKSNRSVICDEPTTTDDLTYTAECRDQNFCPYAEEDTPIDISLQVIQGIQYENYTETFFIRDIVKPDPPQHLTMKKENNNLTISWQYPEFWSKPHSYFPLTFEVKVTEEQKGRRNRKNNEKRDCSHLARAKRFTEHNHAEKVNSYFTDEEEKVITVNPGKNYCVCVRAKDRYFNSRWSSWNCENLVNKRKKRSGNKRKNRV